jgi:hypothetical protein
MHRLAALGTFVIGIGLMAGAVATETNVFGEAGVPIALLVLAGGMTTAGVGIYRHSG